MELSEVTGYFNIFIIVTCVIVIPVALVMDSRAEKRHQATMNDLDRK